MFALTFLFTKIQAAFLVSRNSLHRGKQGECSEGMFKQKLENRSIESYVTRRSVLDTYQKGIDKKAMVVGNKTWRFLSTSLLKPIYIRKKISSLFFLRQHVTLQFHLFLLFGLYYIFKKLFLTFLKLLNIRWFIKKHRIVFRDKVYNWFVLCITVLSYFILQNESIYDCLLRNGFFFKYRIIEINVSKRYFYLFRNIVDLINSINSVRFKLQSK